MACTWTGIGFCSAGETATGTAGGAAPGFESAFLEQA
jgi:hypothetical protein